jgi:hypothetical protein
MKILWRLSAVAFMINLILLLGCKSTEKDEEFILRGEGMVIINLINHMIYHDKKYPTRLEELDFKNVRKGGSEFDLNDLNKWIYRKPQKSEGENIPILQTTLKNGKVIFFYLDGKVSKSP